MPAADARRHESDAKNSGVGGHGTHRNQFQVRPSSPAAFGLRPLVSGLRVGVVGVAGRSRVGGRACAGFGFQAPGCLVGVDRGRRDQPVLALVVAVDVPLVVVEEQMVVFAEQDPVGSVALIYPYECFLASCHLCPYFS